MSKKNGAHSFIFGCGDVGRRIAKTLILSDVQAGDIQGFVNSSKSLEQARSFGISSDIIDLDEAALNLSNCQRSQLYYTVAPQKNGCQDLRSRRVISEFTLHGIRPEKVVLISTTGVYGDCQGQWVTEQSDVKPQTERGKRRLDSENQWIDWGDSSGVDVVVLRVPGIYAFSRLPRERIMSGTPVVRSSECGYTNRIHADDLARICVTAMQKGVAREVYNVTDGTPGKISEFLQAAAQVLNYPALPEISMSQAKTQLSSGMLSYLSESRKISNKKMLEALGIELLYSNFRDGLLN